MAEDTVENLHPLLRRQLRRAGLEADLDPRVVELLRLVNRSYDDHDRERTLMDRSLELSSQEMAELNAKLEADRERLRSELEIAAHLQTSILPKNFTSAFGEAVAEMIPASEVGGDYYDFVPTSDALWIAIGDVAGHGLRSAVVMTMIQSMVSVLIRQDGRSLSPRDLVVTLNRAIHDNVFRRLATRDHATFSLLCCTDDGRVTFAGAHETILVYRASSGTCESIETPGTWLGPMADVSAFTHDGSFVIGEGDLMVLYTDGITEARSERQGRFGLERFTRLIEENGREDLATIRDRVIGAVRAWSIVQEDDLSLLLYRRTT